MKWFLCLLCSSLFGHATHTLYCHRQELDTPLSVYGDFLYWKPCSTPFKWGVESETSTILALTSNYTVGFRMGGAVDYCNLFSSLEFTSIDSSDYVSGRDLFIPLFSSNADTAHARLKFHYRDLLIRAGASVYQCHWLSARGFAGISYIRFSRTQQIFTPDEEYQEIRYAHNVGAEFGAGVSSCDVGGFKLHGLISGRFYPGYCALHLRWSASYTLYFGGPRISGEVGYELTHYFTILSNENFGLWGPYARIEAKF